MPTAQASSQLELVRYLGKRYDKKVQLLGGDGDEMVAQSTERHARCPLHNRQSKDYNGTNEHGWVFRCGGFTAAQVKRWRMKFPGSAEQRVAGIWHYFVARPS